MTAKIVYTHKGWFGLCPVYISDPYSDAPTLLPYLLCGWLLTISEWIFDMCCYLCTLLDPFFEPGYPYFVWSIPLKKPFTRQSEDD